MSTVTVRTTQPARQPTTVRAIAAGSARAAIARLVAVEFDAVLLRAAGVHDGPLPWLRRRPAEQLVCGDVETAATPSPDSNGGF